MRFPRLTITLAAVALSTFALVGTASAGDYEIEDETDITLDQVPAAARATIDAEVGGLPIDEVETGFLNGQRVYEVEFERDGDELEFVVAEDGTLLGYDD